MRTLSTGFLACAVYVLAPALAFGQPQAPPRPEGEKDQSPAAHELAHLLQQHVSPSLEVDKEIAGLSASSHPEVLTWERVYALALVPHPWWPRAARRGPRPEGHCRTGLAEWGRRLRQVPQGVPRRPSPWRWGFPRPERRVPRAPGPAQEDRPCATECRILREHIHIVFRTHQR